VAYFSKEKNSVENYNLAVIIVFPPFQKEGYGRLLMEFSYMISKLEGKTGTPERPLSELGYKGYLSFWTSVLLKTLLKLKCGKSYSLKELSEITGIAENDIIESLTQQSIFNGSLDGNSISLSKGEIKRLVQKYPNLIKEQLIDESCVSYP
jgi:hypothetical protein